MRMKEAKVGQISFYAVGNEPREQAEITEITSDTHVQVKLITGPLSGVEIDAPWDILQPISRFVGTPAVAQMSRVLVCQCLQLRLSPQKPAPFPGLSRDIAGVFVIKEPMNFVCRR
jgi:hypothetical protein